MARGCGVMNLEVQLDSDVVVRVKSVIKKIKGWNQLDSA